MAHVRVDCVCEVDRRRPRREIHDVSLRREHEHLALIEVDLEARHELAGIRHLRLPFEHPPEPGDLGLLVGRARRAALLLVAPVRRDPVLGRAVHLVGSDLYL